MRNYGANIKDIGISVTHFNNQRLKENAKKMTVNTFGQRRSSFYSLKGYLRKRKGAIRWMLVINLFIWGIAFFSYKALDFNMVSANGTLVIEKMVQPSFEQMPTEVKEFVDFYADLYNVNKDMVHKIIDCESKGDPTQIGDQNLKYMSFGLWQFQPQTFWQYAAAYKIKNADIKDWRHQTIIAIQIIANGKISEWSCAKLINPKINP